MLYLTVIAGLESAVIAGLVVALLLHSKGCAELAANLDERHAQQVNRLVAAIQRPDLVQPAQQVRKRTPAELDAWRARQQQFAQAGTVMHAKGD